MRRLLPSAILRRLSLFLFLLAAHGCVVDNMVTKPNGLRPKVRRVILDPHKATVNFGEHLQLIAATFDSLDRAATPYFILWSSVDSAVASVDSTGLVTGLRLGTTRIVVNADSTGDTALITVLTPVGAVRLPDSSRVGLDRYAAVQAVVLDVNGDTLRNQAVTWTSADTAIAQIVSGGNIFGRNAGTTTLVAAAGGFADTTVITVYRWPRLIISPDPADIRIGTYIQFTTRIADSRGAPMTGDSVHWLPPGPGLEATGTPGLFFARGAGASAVAATAGSLTSGAAVNVTFDSVTALAMAHALTCGLSHGQPVCWSIADYGGNGATSPALADTAHWATLGTGYADHICGLTPDGHAHCFGSGASFATSTQTFDKITSGYGFTCGLSSGAAMCVGNGSRGQLGSGFYTSSSTFLHVAGEHQFVDLEAGAYFACGLDTAGAVWCWGINLGQIYQSATPIQLRTGGQKLMATAAASLCTQDTTGTVTCSGVDLGWGGNASPVPPSPAPYTRLIGGYGSSCGITATADLWCWGGEFYFPDLSRAGRAVNGGVPFSDAALDDLQMCGLSAGRVFCEDYLGTPMHPVTGSQ